MVFNGTVWLPLTGPLNSVKFAQWRALKFRDRATVMKQRAGLLAVLAICMAINVGLQFKMVTPVILAVVFLVSAAIIPHRK